MLETKQIVEGNVYRDAAHCKQRVLKINGDSVLLMDVATMRQHSESLAAFARQQEALVPSLAATNQLLTGQDSSGVRRVMQVA